MTDSADDKTQAAKLSQAIDDLLCGNTVDVCMNALFASLAVLSLQIKMGDEEFIEALQKYRAYARRNYARNDD